MHHGELVGDLNEPAVDVGKQGLQREFLQLPGIQSLLLRDEEGLDQPADHVFALIAPGEIPVGVDGVLGSPWMVREQHPGTRPSVQVAEDHGLDRDGRSPVLG